MIQSELNKVRVDEWYDQNLYEEKFRLKLTAKHELVVGRWDYDGEWGVDLREWSYNETRLLGTGITLNSSAWQLLSKNIVRLYGNGYFSNYTYLLKNKLQETINIEKSFQIKTDVFEGNKNFFCINLVDHNGNRVWKGRYAHIGIMVRFDTIHDFILLSRDNGLIEKINLPDDDKGQVDRKTGRKIF